MDHIEKLIAKAIDRGWDEQGCFSPPNYDDPDACANGNCYCQKFIGRQAKFVMEAIRPHLKDTE